MIVFLKPAGKLKAFAAGFSFDKNSDLIAV